MSKKRTIIIASIVGVIASVLSFYFLGCLATGIFNKGQGLVRMLVMLTPGIAGILMPIELIVGLFFIVRIYKRPNAIKRFLKTYSITLIVLSGVGLVAAILAGVLLYKSFIEPSPFPFFIPIIMLWHVAVIVLSIIVLASFRKKIHVVIEDNRGRGVKHILFTIVFALIVYYALNRFGALLISPFYIQWRTLDLTWPFYVTLLALFVLLIQGLLYYFDVYNTSKKKTVGIIVSSVLILGFAASFVATGIIGYSNPLFLSAVSPAVPLERMLTKPIEYIVHCVATLVTSGYVLYMSIHSKVRDVKYNEKLNKLSNSKEIKVEEKKVEVKKVEVKKEEPIKVNEVKVKTKKEEPIKVNEVKVEPKKEEKKVISKPASKKVVEKKEVKKVNANKKPATVKKPVNKTSKPVAKKPVSKKPTVKKKSK